MRRLVVLLLATICAAELILRGYLSLRFPQRPEQIQNHATLGRWFTPNNRFQSEGLRFDTDSHGVIKRASLDRKQGPLVFLLGDSFLEGLQVPPNDNLSERLADRFVGGCRCINLGTSGGSPSFYLLAYRLFKSVFGIPSIVVALFNTEFEDEARLFHGDLLVFDSSHRIVRIKEPVETTTGMFWAWGGWGVVPFRQYWWEYRGPMQLGILRNEWARRVSLPRLQKSAPPPPRQCSFETHSVDTIGLNALSAFKADLTPEDMQAIERTFSPLLALKHEADEDRTRMIVVVLPSQWQFPNVFVSAKAQCGLTSDQSLPDHAQHHISAYLGRHEIESLDLLPVFRAHRGPPLFGEAHGHFTKEGHDLVAREIYDFVRPGRRQAPH